MADEESARAELEQAILAAIEPYKGLKEKPPFSPVEILTMATFMCQCQHSCDPNGFTIMYWVYKTFPYFADPDTRSPIFDTFDNYETPSCVADDAGNTSESEYHVKLQPAQASLRRALGLEPKAPFRFFGLPPELRERIYEMVLYYLLCGAIPIDWDQEESPRFWLATKDSSAPFSFDAWTADKYPWGWEKADEFNTLSHEARLEKMCWADHYEFVKQSCQEKLALLLANKQIFEAAMPVFNRMNTFMFISVGHLGSRLKTLPPSRRQHLRSIAFRYVPADTDVAASTFGSLSALPKLRKLFIDIDEDSWTRIKKFEDKERELLKIPGLDELRKIRGLKEVGFSSRCRTIAGELKEVMEGKGDGNDGASTGNVGGVEAQGEAFAETANENPAEGAVGHS